MLIRKVQQVFGAAETNRVQEASEAFDSNVPTLFSIVEWSGYIFAKRRKAMERVGSQKCKQ
jgi:hypothetical protein